MFVFNPNRIYLLIFFLLFVFSCSLFWESDEYIERGSLSEVIEKSSDNYKGERKVARTKVKDREIKDEPSWKEPYRGNYDDRDYSRDYPWDDDGPKIFSSDTLFKEMYDSTGQLNVSRFIQYYSVPNFIPGHEKIERITIKSIDSTGAQKEYVILKRSLVSDDKGSDDDVKEMADKTGNVWTVKEKTRGYALGAYGFYGLGSAQRFRYFSGAGLHFSIYPIPLKHMHTIELGASARSIKDKSNLSHSIDELKQIRFGYQYKKYTTPPFTVIGIFLIVGGEYTLSSWSYKNAIVSDVYDDNEHFLYTDTIGIDFLSGFGIHSGMGLTLFKTKMLTMDIESRIGIVLYDLKTFERFDNDVFYPDVYVRFGVGMSVPFGG